MYFSYRFMLSVSVYFRNSKPFLVLQVIPVAAVCLNLVFPSNGCLCWSVWPCVVTMQLLFLKCFQPVFKALFFTKHSTAAKWLFSVETLDKVGYQSLSHSSSPTVRWACSRCRHKLVFAVKPCCGGLESCWARSFSESTINFTASSSWPFFTVWATC